MARTIKQKEQQRQADQRYRKKHKERMGAYNRKYQDEHKEQIARQHHIWWKKWYALNKESRRVYARKYQMEHSLEIKLKGKESRRKLKTEVLTQYGNSKCACVRCGESRLACLSLDHIRGGGRERHREGEFTGVRLYAQLKKLGFPKGDFQTLCMNCQWIKRVENNELPWQTEKL